MSYQLLITTTETKHHWIEVGYGSYRQGKVAAVSSSSVTASFDTKQEACDAAEVLSKDPDVKVTKLFKD
jgi:hypothetical protein